MTDTKALLDQARAALRAGEARQAIELADQVLAARGGLPQALYIRAQAQLRNENSAGALMDCLEGLEIDNLDPQMAQRFEALVLGELLKDLDKNPLAARMLAGAGAALQRAPRVGAMARLLALLGEHDVTGAIRFGSGLTDAESSAPLLRLTSHVLLSDNRLDAAINSLGKSLTLEKRSPLSDLDLMAMAQYRQQHRAGLRDPAVFPQRYRLAVCTVLKDEADDLEEWLAYHANLGVEAFYLYDNDSADATPGIIAACSQRFNITHHRISRQPAQKLAYRHFLEVHRFDAEWAAMIDADEYINPLDGKLIDYTVRHENCAAIAMNWTVFGTSGLRSKPDGLCIESFVKRARDDDGVNAHIKGIVRPRRVIRYLCPHVQLMLGRYEDAMGNIVFPMHSRVSPPRHEGLRLHHYALKSHQQAQKKLARGRPVADHHAEKFRDDSYIGRFDHNDVEDRSAARFAPAVRRLLAGQAAEE